MDRGAALNCKIIHNWDERKLKGKKSSSSENDNDNVTKQIIKILGDNN